MATTSTRPLLLGEWACLGILAQEPAHGYTLARRLAPDGDVGRIWSVSRALTYRAAGHLIERGYARELRAEPGIAGGMRTPLAPTAKGRKVLAGWLLEPVTHLRDVRTELLLKLQLCRNLGVDPGPLLDAQRRHFAPVAASLRSAGAGEPGADPVTAWRHEYSTAAMRFLDRVATANASTARS